MSVMTPAAWMTWSRAACQAMLGSRAEAAAVRAAIDALPPDQSRVIELGYFGGFTHTEIAEMLQTPVGTVKGRMRLGLRKMHEQLRHGEVTL